MAGCSVRLVMWGLLTQLPIAIYGDWIFDQFPLQSVPLWVMLPLTLGGWLVGFFLYTDYLVFLSIWAIGVLASAFIWRNARMLWVERLLALPFLLALMAGPYQIPLIYGSYEKLEHEEYFEAYLGKTSDKQLNWLTAPQGSLGGAIRRAQYQLDIYGCIYRLRGWSEDNKLYYDTGGSNIVGLRTCAAQVWEYDPESGGGPRPTGWLTGDFVPASEIVAGPPFEEKEKPAAGGMTIAWPKRIVEESTSPDGTMRAAVIQDWTSLQYDVVVMEPRK